MTTDSELESLQCAPFHAPLPPEDATEKHQRHLDSLVFARCLKNATKKKWEVRYRENYLDAYFMCYQEETGVKLRTATMDTSYWTTATIREHADIIAEIFRQEQARE